MGPIRKDSINDVRVGCEKKHLRGANEQSQFEADSVSCTTENAEFAEMFDV